MCLYFNLKKEICRNEYVYSGLIDEQSNYKEFGAFNTQPPFRGIMHSLKKD